MSEPRLLEVARQGDPRAISTLLNAVLLPKRVKAEVDRQGSRLDITLHSEKMLNQEAAVTLIQTALEKLHLPEIDQVVMESRVLGAPLWDSQLTLGSPQPPPEAKDESPPLPPVVDPWQSHPEPPPAADPDTSEPPAVTEAARPADAPTLMDLIAAFVESDPESPTAPPPPSVTESEESQPEDLERLEVPENWGAAAPVVDFSTAAATVPPVADATPTPESKADLEEETVTHLPEPVANTADTGMTDPEPTAAPLTPEAPPAYPPLGDPWLEGNCSPGARQAETAAIASEGVTAVPPQGQPQPPIKTEIETQAETQTELSEPSPSDTAEYTTPTIEKVARDGQSKVAGVAGMVMGLGFCATGLGTVIGLPMVVGGMWMLGDEELWRGDCPHCRQSLKVPVGKLWRFSCPSCQGLIEIKHGRFYARQTPQTETPPDPCAEA